ncbi:P22 coat protein [compost metagenome]
MATNSLLTINMITREALRLFVNSNAFLKNIDRQYDDQFAKVGAKIGDTLRIRLPNDYTVRNGKTASIQNTTEQSRSLTVSTQQGVDIAFSSAERALSLDDYSERVLKPAMNNLAGAVAMNIMANADNGSNLVFKDGGAGVIATPDATTWLLAGAKLDMMSSPRGDRKIMLDPLTQARTVSSLSGLFNPQRKIGDQYETGEMSRDTLGFDWFMDQTVIKHTNGTFTAGAVGAAGQTGTTLATGAITGTLKKGDIITITGVNSVNRVTKQSNGELAQFVVTADVSSGATSIPIYPAIVAAPAAYATVTASPAAGAPIALVTPAGATYRKNIAYNPMAFTLATADLELPRGVHEAARATYDGISMRAVTAYDVKEDDFITRLDILYGSATLRPEWVVCVPDTL